MPATSKRRTTGVHPPDASADFETLPLVEWRDGPDGPPTVRIFVVAVATDAGGGTRRFVHPLAFAPRPASTVVSAARIHDWERDGISGPVDLYADAAGGTYRASAESSSVDERRQAASRAEVFALYLLGPEFSPPQLGWTCRPVLKGLRVVNARMAKAERLPSLEGLAASGFVVASTNVADLEAAVRQVARNSFAWTGSSVARRCVPPHWNVVCTVGGRITLSLGVGDPVSSGVWAAGAAFGLGEYARALAFGKRLAGSVPGGKLVIKGRAEVHDAGRIVFNGGFRTAEAMANPVKFALRKVEARFAGTYAERRISDHLTHNVRIRTGDDAKSWWASWASVSRALPLDLPPDDVPLRRLLILRASLDGCGYAPAGEGPPPDPVGEAVQRIRMACLHVLNELVPYLERGGDEYRERWSLVMRACTEFGEKRTERNAQALAGATFLLWLSAPEAFPANDAAVLSWARGIRPRMEDVIMDANHFEDGVPRPALPMPASPGAVAEPVEAAPSPADDRRPRMTMNGRMVYEALDGRPAMRKVEIAEVAGLGRGAANRTIVRLVGEGWLVEEPGGLFRRA